MTKKPAKRSPAVSSEDGPEDKKDIPARGELIKDAPRPLAEGPDNLRRRSAWFRRRTGNKEPS